MSVQQPHFVFFRNPPSSQVWGGLEKLVCEWFERIDYDQCKVTFVVSHGWKETYKKVFESKKLPIDILEVNFDPTMNLFKKFLTVYVLLRNLKPNVCIFVQGRFFCFHFMHILGARLITNNIYMHENLGAPEPWVKSSKKYFGFISGLALWWHAEKLQTRCRAYLCRKILTVSRGVKENLVNFWHYPEDKILVCHHGIDLSLFQSGAKDLLGIRNKLGIKSEDQIIIVTARLSKEKCIDRVINAFDDLNDPRLNLLILGTGPLEKDLKILANQKASQARIFFLGHVENVFDYLKAADYFVLSSDNEGLSLSLLEAMASGLICLATPCPGPMELIEHGTNGFLINKSSEGVREGLQKVMGMSLSQSKVIKEAAVSFVRNNFELDRCVLNALSIFGIPLKA